MANLTGANFREALLVEANLLGADGGESVLYSCSLHGATMAHGKTFVDQPNQK